jgi:hypothetical protein
VTAGGDRAIQNARVTIPLRGLPTTILTGRWQMGTVTTSDNTEIFYKDLLAFLRS